MVNYGNRISAEFSNSFLYIIKQASKPQILIKINLAQGINPNSTGRGGGVGHATQNFVKSGRARTLITLL